MSDRAGRRVTTRTMSSDAGPVTLELVGVSRAFPGAQALQDVSMTVHAGHVHALLGENGAGKSTLIKIVTGALAVDSGAVLIDGVALRRANPRAAQQQGVRVVHQERQIAGDLSVADNVLLDAIPATRFGFTRRAAVLRAGQEQLDRLGIDIDAARPAGTLPAAEQQLVELARAVNRKARVVVLDEPTASLRQDEVDTLFAVMERLRADGTSVLFISHHLDEVFRVADRATVLRNGRHAGDVPIAGRDGASRKDLMTLMFGRDIAHARLPRRTRPGDAVLTARGVRLIGRLEPMDLTVRRGEVLVLCGPAGSGASELAELLSGVQSPDGGEVSMHERPAANQQEARDTGHSADRRQVRGRPAAARSGIGYVPADRKGAGLLLDRSVTENVLLGCGRGRTDAVRLPTLEHRAVGTAVRANGVKAPDVRAAVKTLSGGNQQKVILTRWLMGGVEVLVLDEPTAGVDVAAKFEIYRRLLDLAEQGIAVVVVSSDYEEIAALADRVLVLRDGRLVAGLGAAELDAYDPATAVGEISQTLYQLELGLQPAASSTEGIS